MSSQGTPLPEDAPLLAEGDGRVARPRRRRLRRTLLVLLVAVALLMSCLALTGWYLQHRITSELGRINSAFAGLDEAHRPAKVRAAEPGGHAVNLLLIGTDRVSEVPTTGTDAGADAWVAGAQRSDTLMLVHIDGDRRSVAVVSIPRDSWVDVPGHGPAKINAAYSYGGPSLTIATVEQLTGIRVDHLAVIDWSGFRELTDAVGGVDIQIPESVYDPSNRVQWDAGRHHLNGKQALLYVRQRYGLPGGDFDRVARQQAYLRAILEASLHQEMRKDPKMLYQFLATVAKNVSVDAQWSTTDMAKLAFSLRNLRSADIRFLTAPVLGTGRVGNQSIVRLDAGAGRTLWKDLRADRIDQWSAVHWDQLTGKVVR